MISNYSRTSSSSLSPPQPRPIGPIAARIVCDLAYRRLVQKVHILGPRVLAELLAEIGCAHGIRGSIETRLRRYASLTPEKLAVTGGNRWPAIPVYDIERRAG